MQQFQNADGTYNGVALMAKATGLSAAEIKWSFDRMKHLLHVDKKSKTEAVTILREECRTRPWEVAT